MCYLTPRLFLDEASESELFRVVKSLEKGNQVPPSVPTFGALVSRWTGGDGGGGAEADGGVGGDWGGGGGSRKGKGVSPHSLASALLFFLHRLPEPLLTFRRREAFLSCEVSTACGVRKREIAPLGPRRLLAGLSCLLAKPLMRLLLLSGCSKDSPFYKNN